MTFREIPIQILIPLVYGTWFVALEYWPKYSHIDKHQRNPRWELPARMVATVALILVLSEFATYLGPNLAGALASYPVIISVLGGFSHRRSGPTAHVATMHGLMQVLPLAITIMTILAITL